MNSVEDFIKSLVKVDQMEDGSYGHYPFQMSVVTSEDKFELTCIAGISCTEEAYTIYSKAIKAGAKKAYLSLDFPPSGDLDKDFVAVYSYEGEEITAIGIPYDVKTGEVFEKNTTSDILPVLVEQLTKIKKLIVNAGS